TGTGCAWLPGGTQIATPAACFWVVGMPMPTPPPTLEPQLPAPTDTAAGAPPEPTPITTTPLAPSLAASSFRRLSAASVWPWVPKPTALVASIWAISTEPGGAVGYTWTCSGSIGGRAVPIITRDELAQPARARARQVMVAAILMFMAYPLVDGRMIPPVD